MSRIQPRTLSNSELISLCVDYLDDPEGSPHAVQHELLRRFIALAPLNEFPPKDERQLDLFLDK
jgi:hypothetical protein